jgi:hypothetical protein
MSRNNCPGCATHSTSAPLEAKPVLLVRYHACVASSPAHSVQLVCLSCVLLLTLFRLRFSALRFSSCDSGNQLFLELPALDAVFTFPSVPPYCSYNHAILPSPLHIAPRSSVQCASTSSSSTRSCHLDQPWTSTSSKQWSKSRRSSVIGGRTTGSFRSSIIGASGAISRNGRWCYRTGW